MFALSMLMGIMICILKGPLVIILILGLGLSALSNIILLISLIFLFKSSEKFFLIFRILPIFLEETWVYKGLPISTVFWFLLGAFLLWNLDFSRTSFNSLEESWGGGSLEKFASLVEEGELVFFPLLGEGTLLVNSSLMSTRKILLLESVLS